MAVFSERLLRSLFRTIQFTYRFSTQFPDTILFFLLSFAAMKMPTPESMPTIRPALTLVYPQGKSTRP